jgi:transcriptional regulator of acetoin/glycerol metabolism
MTRTGGVIQVVAASAIPLLPLLERGTFVDTLYYRLNVLYIRGTAWRECRRTRRTRRPIERAVRCHDHGGVTRVDADSDDIPTVDIPTVNA